MKTYSLGLVSPRFVAIASSTNATPIVITTSTPHGISAGDVVTVNGHLVNTNANGTYASGYIVLSPTTFSVPPAGNGVGAATGTVSGPQRLSSAPAFPSIQGVSDPSKLLVAGIRFSPIAATTGVLFVGLAGLNQNTFANVIRALNPAPPTGQIDEYTISGDGRNDVPIGDYFIDASKPSTEGALVSFWLD